MSAPAWIVFGVVAGLVLAIVVAVVVVLRADRIVWGHSDDSDVSVDQLRADSQQSLKTALERLGRAQRAREQAIEDARRDGEARP